jgi:hypothetical protein
MIRTKSILRDQGTAIRAGAVVALAWLLAWGGNGWTSAESVTLAWDPNAESDLAGYRLYYGTTTRSYDHTVEVIGDTRASVSDLEPGITYYFAVTAHNTAGLESDYSNEVLYTVEEQPDNRPPFALNLDLVITANQSVPVTLDGFDPDGDDLSYAVVAGPLHGSISGTAPSLTYTPQTGFVGVDGFSYTVTDGQVTSAPAQVTITVAEDPNPPPTGTPPTIVDAQYLGYGLVLTWTSEPGSSYRVLVKDGFSADSWTPISDEILAGGLRTSWLDPVATAVGGRLYRVELVGL